MPSDQVVNSQDILQSIMQLRRLGNQHVLEDLERQEADLMEYMLEEYSAIHQDLSKLGTAPKPLRRITRRIETMALVLVMSLRQSHLRLWQQDQAPTKSLPSDSAGADIMPGSKPQSPEQ